MIFTSCYSNVFQQAENFSQDCGIFNDLKKFFVLTSAPSMLIFSALRGKQKKIHHTFCICCGSILSGWFKFYFSCFEVLAMYDNEFETKENKI